MYRLLFVRLNNSKNLVMIGMANREWTKANISGRKNTKPICFDIDFSNLTSKSNIKDEKFYPYELLL